VGLGVLMLPFLIQSQQGSRSLQMDGCFAGRETPILDELGGAVKRNIVGSSSWHSAGRSDRMASIGTERSKIRG
jgi:hypothetical protein